MNQIVSIFLPTARLVAALVAGIALAACAPKEAQLTDADEWEIEAEEAYDPAEGFNRAVFNLNENVLDPVFVRPLGSVYKGLPPPVKSGMGNFLDNLGEPVNAANGALQLKFDEAGRSLARFAANTVFGLAGIFDVAADSGLERTDEDFGQTLGHYGFARSAYLYLPFLGPSTVADTGGLVADGVFFSPTAYVEEVRVRNGIAGVKAARARAAFLEAEEVLEGAVLDKYGAVRDIYVERRRALIEDRGDDDF
jgi:phospholipid-binding lipoprotein MlaA